MEKSGKPNGMGTWRRYKLGQAQFTSWLKQTAEKLGTRSKTEPDGPTNGHGNGEGDAASQQSRRQKKKAKATPLNLDAGNEKFVHWTQLEVLAQRVADNAQPEDVPDVALNILRDVVGLRKKSFSFFSRSTKDSKDEKVKRATRAMPTSSRCSNASSPSWKPS